MSHLFLDVSESAKSIHDNKDDVKQPFFIYNYNLAKNKKLYSFCIIVFFY